MVRGNHHAEESGVRESHEKHVIHVIVTVSNMVPEWYDGLTRS